MCNISKIFKSRTGLRQKTVALPIIVGTSALLILINACTIRITSAVRSYVNGESLYSKSQKDATRHLLMYINTGNERHWNYFNTAISVPLGDSLARVAITDERPDAETAAGFIQGKNNPDDVPDMIWLFRNFKNAPFMKAAISRWKAADLLVGRLVRLGNDVHARRSAQNMTIEHINGFTYEIEKVSAELNIQEEAFSSILGAAARKINTYLFYTNIVFTLLIVGSGVRLMSSMFQRLAVVNERLRKTLDFGGLGSGSIDFDKMELTLSSELLHILELNPISPRKITLQRFLGYFVPEEKHEKFYDRLRASQQLDGHRNEIDIEFEVITIKKKVKLLRLKTVVSGSKAFAIIQDITPIRKLELDALARARYIEQILYSITDGFFAVDAQWRLTLVNPEFARLADKLSSELIGKTLWEVFPTMKKSVQDKYYVAMQSGEPQNFEVPVGEITFDVQAYPHEEGLLVCVKDISEKKRFVSALAEREQYLKQVLQGLPVAVCLTDADGVITSYNGAARQLWDRVPLPDERWCGSHRLMTRAGIPLAHQDSPTAIAMKYKVPLNNVEGILERPCGEQVNVMTYVTPFRKECGAFAGAMSVMIDITSRRKMELALKVREKEEERKRVSNLIEGQELERARLSREMHDGLGQLLNAIQFNLECLGEGNLLEVKQKVVGLISETLSESRRISSNLLPLKVIDFDLATCVSSLCEQLNSDKVKVIFQTRPFKDAGCKQQRFTLYRIIQEGLQNAIKHSGCTRIFVQLYQDDSGLHISIEDDGKGFDQETKIDAGHGLRNIRYRAEVLNGKLEIESSPQYGTLISISIPQNIAA